MTALNADAGLEKQVGSRVDGGRGKVRGLWKSVLTLVGPCRRNTPQDSALALLGIYLREMKMMFTQNCT